MIISEEQVRCAAEYLKTQRTPTCSSISNEVPDPALVAGIVDMLSRTPEIRLDRIESARYMIDGHMPDAGEVASKLIGRVISDSLR